MAKFSRDDGIAVIGTGMIGPDICASVLLAGAPVTMIGRSRESVERGLSNLENDLDDYRQSGIISDSEMSAMRDMVRTSTVLESGLREAGIIFEAVSEELTVKQKLFADIEKVCRPDAILCSSTSGLSPDDMAAKMVRLRRLLVTHFWNPAHLVPLVEVVFQTDLDQDAGNKALALLERLGKVPVVLKKDILGHIGNRLQHALYREALFLIETGVATPDDIDKVVLNSFGPRYSTIGPMEYFDSCGLDLQLKVERYLFPDLCRRNKPMSLLLEKVKAGELGEKTGRGLHDWSGRDSGEFRRRRNQRFVEYLKHIRRSH